MSVNVPREVIVDDNETGMLYNGSWSLSNGQDFRRKGINPFSNSLHGTTGEADFSYSFTGVLILRRLSVGRGVDTVQRV